MNKIKTGTFFISMHEQQVFQNMGLFRGESYPVAEELSKKTLYLPSSSGLSGSGYAWVIGSDGVHR